MKSNDPEAMVRQYWREMDFLCCEFQDMAVLLNPLGKLLLAACAAVFVSVYAVVYAVCILICFLFRRRKHARNLAGV